MSENTKSPLLIVLIVLVCVLIVLQQTGWKLLESQEVQNTGAVTQDVNAGTPAAVIEDDNPADMSISYEDMEILVKALPPQQREQLLGNAEVFGQLVQQERNFRSLLKGALESGLGNDERVALLMERASNRMLAESYLSLLLNKNVEGKMPTDQDVKDFYLNNPDQFEVPDRVYLSQIFFSTTSDNEEAVMSLAQESYDKLTNGKAEFASLAKKYSEHPSKANGGDMGPININGMLPEIRDAVQQLKENAISPPIKTKSGIHILRKGGVIKSEKLSLEQANPQIRNSMNQSVQNKLRIAIIEKLTEKFPVSIDTADIQSWRTQLRTGE